MIASLPMYDWPELRAATDAWWAGLARHLGLTCGLDRTPDHAASWRRPELRFSQTCGYPFTHALKGRLRLVATPHYAVDGCAGPDYCSLVLAREQRPLKTFAGARAAVNTPDSMSGMLALKIVFAPHAADGRFFGSVLETGGHAASLAAVRAGHADVCAIDAVCVGLARAYRPDDLAGLIEIARSPPAPGLPYVTSAERSDREVEAMRAGLRAAFADQALDGPRKALFLSGLSVLSASAYDRIVDLERSVERAGGFELI